VASRDGIATHGRGPVLRHHGRFVCLAPAWRVFGKDDQVAHAALGDHVFGHHVEAKRAEWDEYRTQVSDWEVDRYLDQF
jgi:hypothetical protein